MTESQKQVFEAFAVLRAHTQLFAQLIEQGTTEDMKAQLAQVQEALAKVVVTELKKAA